MFLFNKKTALIPSKGTNAAVVPP